MLSTSSRKRPISSRIASTSVWLGERGIRPTKLGAKNWLYIGHPDAGWRSAVIYSITGTCKLLKVNPVDYLTWVLPRLATTTSGQLDGLLPHDYAAAVARA